MHHTQTSYFLLEMFVFVAALTSIVVGCLLADRTVKEGTVVEAEQRRRMTERAVDAARG